MTVHLTTLGDVTYVVDAETLADAIAQARQLATDAGRKPGEFVASTEVRDALISIGGAWGRYYTLDTGRFFCRGCVVANRPKALRTCVVREVLTDPTGRRVFHYCADHVDPDLVLDLTRPAQETR